MSVEHNEHGDAYDPTWKPGNPSLCGVNPGEALGTPAPPATKTVKADELRHSDRVRRGLVNDRPDPGYDPGEDDLDPTP